ncbi:carboxymuconolactone decarboxylase family protein [Ferrovibrio sp.]|uniref:carboxymuconolactone decarboxylase family protein n=1 Tax=Ferrovibrio sp. TaxID=1917215 RepID=UPI0025C2AC71|nr:carboxymuconolactone decarboxylase family protein [Ferrovibrio sp.]MBX3453623.1 carboxymuconolactone decarboxylase family protein [Ferrovibrio sp.]
MNAAVINTVSPEPTYLAVFAGEDTWLDAMRQRFAHIEAGQLQPKLRELVFVVGYTINRYGVAARYHSQRALAAGATQDDLRLILKILDFYRGLRGFQDAQKLLGLWRSGVFPEVKPPKSGTIADIFRKVVETRKYIANGFRVYAADGEWLRLYLQRSDAIKLAPRTLDERGVQLMSMAITLKNHGFSSNWNDGCIEVHENKTKALGSSDAEILEVVQILELCDSMTTAWEGRALLGLDGAAE